MSEPEVSMIWEDGGIADVKITCCNQTDNEMFHSGDSWICPRCGAIIDFIWKGMEYKIRKLGNKTEATE